MTFNVNSQNAAQINNVAGDQHISGGQHGTVVTIGTARDAAKALRDAVAAAPLPDEAAEPARVLVEEMDAEMSKETPDPPTVADRGRRLVELLTSAGSLATAGAAIVGPLQTLATWLGHLGEPILRLLAPVL